MDNLRQLDFKQQKFYTFYMKNSGKVITGKVHKVQDNNLVIKVYDSTNNNEPYQYVIDGKSIEWYKEWYDIK